MKIIVCDDEKENLLQIGTMLNKITCISSRNVKIEYCLNSQECIECLRNEKACLIILDMQLQECLGIALARKLRELQKDFKLIFISDINSYAAETYEVNADGYLLKPLDEGRFIEVVDSILQDMLACY